MKSSDKLDFANQKNKNNAPNQNTDHVFLNNVVNTILEPMIQQLVTFQPEDPVEYMITWIRK